MKRAWLVAGMILAINGCAVTEQGRYERHEKIVARIADCQMKGGRVRYTGPIYGSHESALAARAKGIYIYKHSSVSNYSCDR